MLSHSNNEDYCKKVAYRFNSFTLLSDNEKYIFLMTTEDPHILAWQGKHIAQFLNKHCDTRPNIMWFLERYF